MKTFGKAFREARQKAELTMGQVARELNLSVSYIADVEHDRRKPFKPEQIMVAAELLNCDPHSMLALAARERGSITVTSRDDRRLNTAAGLARSIDVLTEEDLKAIDAIVHRRGSK